MTDSSLSFVVAAASVALITFATRQLGRAKGAELPRVQVGKSIYGIKWQLRFVGYAGALFFFTLIIWFGHEVKKVGDQAPVIIFLAFGLLALWIANGSVTTDEFGVTKKGLIFSRSFAWGEITEILLHKRDGGAIELHAGPQKMIVDSRFVARKRLLDVIVAKTKLQPQPGS